MTAAAASMRTWIDQLPGQAFFFTHEIPDWNPSLRSTLARIATDPDHPVTRIAHGFYCKRWHQDSPQERRFEHANAEQGSLHFGGCGSGPANWNALNLVGWTTQHPARKDIACLTRPPRSPWRYIRYVQRSNRRRAEATWAEIAVLEALRMHDRRDIDWDEAADIFTTGDYLARLRYDAEVDRERLRWIAEGERRLPAAFMDHVHALCGIMPAYDSYRQWRQRFATTQNRVHD